MTSIYFFHSSEPINNYDYHEMMNVSWVRNSKSRPACLYLRGQGNPFFSITSDAEKKEEIEARILVWQTV